MEEHVHEPGDAIEDAEAHGAVRERIGERKARCAPEPRVRFDRVEVGKEQRYPGAAIEERAADVARLVAMFAVSPANRPLTAVEQGAELLGDETRIVERGRDEGGTVDLGEREARTDVANLPFAILLGEPRDSLERSLERRVLERQAHGSALVVAQPS